MKLKNLKILLIATDSADASAQGVLGSSDCSEQVGPQKGIQ